MCVIDCDCKTKDIYICCICKGHDNKTFTNLLIFLQMEKELMVLVGVNARTVPII